MKPFDSLPSFTPRKLTALMVATLMLSACNKPAESDAEVALDLEAAGAKEAYAIGVSSGQSMARNIESLDGTGINLNNDLLIRGFKDGIHENSKLSEEELQTVMQDFRTRVNTAMQEKRKQEQEEQAKVAEENKGKGAAFLEENKAKDGIVVLESGLQYKVLEEGEGASPTQDDRVKVHYKGTLIDGSQFDSSYDRGSPATFGVTQVIKGWTEALQLMKEGSKWQLFIPSELAYGETPRPQIPGNSVLLFDVELLEIVKKEEPKKEDDK